MFFRLCSRAPWMWMAPFSCRFWSARASPAPFGASPSGPSATRSANSLPSSPAKVEGSCQVTLKLSPRDPSTALGLSCFKALPVCEASIVATCSGVPAATISPPSSPASGPRSMIQSAHLITSRLCSITIREWPASMSRWNNCNSIATSSKCRPVVGSSKMKRFPRQLRGPALKRAPPLSVR